MIKLGGVAVIDDFRLANGGMSLEEVENQITHQLASSFAKKLVGEKDFQRVIVKREDGFHTNPFTFGATAYEARMVLLTPDEAKEYEELKKFREEMQKFVHVEPYNKF